MEIVDKHRRVKEQIRFFFYHHLVQLVLSCDIVLLPSRSDFNYETTLCDPAHSGVKIYHV